MLASLEFLKAYLKQYAGCFKNYGCIYVQHILRSNMDCAKFLEQMGLRRDCLRIFGKAYSTSELVLADYHRDNYFAHSIGDEFDYTEPFDQAVYRAISAEVPKLFTLGIEDLLIIDEGGIAIRALADHNPFRSIAATELTSRGAEQYHLLAASSPIVDVARSSLKKEIEPRLIAASMIEHTSRVISKEFNVQFHDLHIGIVGAGAIGGEIISQFRTMGLAPSWFDPKYPHSQAISLSHLVDESDIIFSSTGIGADWSDYLMKKNRRLILVNAGSSDIEFRLWELKHSLQNKIAFLLKHDEKPWKQTVKIQFPSCACFFLRGGFPINFDNSEDPISADKIQVSRAALMAGAVQAVTSLSRGVIPANQEWQEALISHFNWRA